MKYLIQLVAVVSLVLAIASCEDEKDDIKFEIDTEQISIGAEGGTKTVKVQTNGKWMASTEAPWVSLSPANGLGVTECQIKVDTTLLADEERQGIVRFMVDGQEPRTLQVIQNGFEKMIQLSLTEVELPTYGEQGKRTFEVELTSNVEFNIEIPEADKNWLKVEDFKFELDRGSRPRTVKLVFNWENNSRPWERITDILFKPKKGEELTKNDSLKITQEKAPLIEDNARGDSLAIVGCMRSLGKSMESNEGEMMANWSFVTLWYASDENVNPDDIGRVRSVSFASFPGKEGIPYEIQFLTRAEEISFKGSESKLLGSFSTGPDLSKLTQLKHLQIYGFGLTTLDPSFIALKNLETLEISGNNFSKFPDILTPENFPKLRYLDLGGNGRWSFSDLTNPPSHAINFGDKDTWGGLLGEFPEQVLRWDSLKYLSLSNNLIYGKVPDMKNYSKVYTSDDLVNDTLPAILLGKPKVLPVAEKCRINLNLLEGEIPEWILYHPNLWQWDPFTLVFGQNESMINLDGKSPRFSNAPVNWDYYWEKYPHRKPENNE